MKKENGHPKAAPKLSQNYYADVSANAQRARLLDALHCGPVTTIEARRDRDIMMPAARIKELRNRGYHIETFWTTQNTDAGRPHRIAQYVLVTERVSPCGVTISWKASECYTGHGHDSRPLRSIPD